MADKEGDLVKKNADIINWKIQAEEWNRREIKDGDMANKILSYVYLRPQDLFWKSEPETEEPNSIAATQDSFNHKTKIFNMDHEAGESPVVFESSLNIWSGLNIQDPFQFFEYPFPEELVGFMKQECPKKASEVEELQQMQKKPGFNRLNSRPKAASHKEKFLQIYALMQNHKKFCNRRKEKCTQTQDTKLPRSPTRPPSQIASTSFQEPSLEDTPYDVEICVGKRLFKSHKILLMSVSDWFRKKFNDIPCNTQRINLEGIDSEVFRVVHHWMYTYKLDVDLKNMSVVLDAATKLEIPALMDKLKTSLLKIIVTNGPLLTFRELDRSCDNLSEYAASLLNENISCLAQCDAFLRYNTDDVCRLFSSEFCSTVNPKKCFSLVLKWLLHDWTLRKGNVNRILNLIDCSSFTNDEMIECFNLLNSLRLPASCESCKEVVFHGLMRRISKSSQAVNTNTGTREVYASTSKPQDMCSDCRLPRSTSGSSKPSLTVLDSSTFDRNYKSESHISQTKDLKIEVPKNESKIKVPRRNGCLRTYFLLAGGIDPFQNQRNLGNTLLYYNVNDNAWGNLEPMPGSRHHGAAALYHGVLFYTGGSVAFDGDFLEATNTVWVYYPSERHWSIKNPMIYPRMYHSLLSVNGLLYAIGGMDQNNRLLNSIESYESVSDSWNDVVALNHARMGMSCAVYHQMVLICGGIGEDVATSSSLLHKSCELFNPKLKKVLKMKPLRIPRCFATLSVANDQLFLIGGATIDKDKDVDLKSVSDIDIWDEKSKTWMRNNSLTSARQDMGCGVVGNRIYIMGGQSSQAKSTELSIECYDHAENRFIQGVSPLPIGVSGTTYVILDSVPCFE